MKIVIDANILFSGLISNNGEIPNLLLNPIIPCQRYTCHFLIIELFKYQAKISKLSGRSSAETLELLYGYLGKMQIINEALLPPPIIKEAQSITQDIDPKDFPFVALAMHLNAKIWTGDKKLSKGLERKGYQLTISTQDLRQHFGLS